MEKIIQWCSTVTFIFIFSCPLWGLGVDEKQILETYYVSSSLGDDGNDGLTPESPKQHISSINKKRDICIKLKRNDVFFEQLLEYKNCIIEDYGKGDRPVLCGFKVLTNPNAWFYDDGKGCWVLDMNIGQNFAGAIKGDVGDSMINNIGFIYDPKLDKVYGRRVKYMEELNENGRFFISDQYESRLIDRVTFRYLYWKLDYDPRMINNLCFSTYLVGIRHMNGCSIRNIAIVGFNFGIVTCDNTIIDNCQIDLIGGSVAIGFNGWVRYGNGIEFSWGNKNSTIMNCMISRTFDCGASIQASGNFNGSPENICFINNSFYHCRQAFEFFLNPSNDSRPQYYGCTFSENVCYSMGDNEFSQPEPRDANLLSYDHFGKSISIVNNIFFGAPHFCGLTYPSGMQDNVIYLYEGQYLTHYHDRRSYPSVYAKSNEDIESYRLQSFDNSVISILKKGSWKAKRIEKRIKKKIGWKPVNLRLGGL